MTTRFRSRSGPSASSLVYVNFNYGGANHTHGPFQTASKIETMEDVVQKNFWSRIKAGEIIINPCSYVFGERQTIGNGSGTFRDGLAYEYTLSGPLTRYTLSTEQIPDVYPSDPTNMANLVAGAKHESLAQINKPALETGEDMLELRETLNLLRNPLKGILQNVDNFRKHYVKKHGRNSKDQALTVLDALSSSWLEYRMAFSPLIRSVHDILQEVSNKTSSPPEIRRAHGRRNSSGDWQKRVSHTSGQNQYVFNGTLSRVASAHAVVIYKVNNATFGNAWRYGLRARDFPKSFWAVVPLSFMVDRIFDVSKMISGVTNLIDPSVVILGCSITVKSETNRTVQMVSHEVPGKGSASGEVILDSEFLLTRDLWIPSVADTVPVVKPVGLIDSSEKIGDLAALVYQALRRKI